MTVTPLHTDLVPIPPASLARWQAVAAGLGLDGWTLARELRLLAGDPSRHNLKRCIRCATMMRLYPLASEMSALL